MNASLTFEEAEKLFHIYMNKFLEEHPLTEAQIADAQETNAAIRYTVYFQDFLRVHNMAMLQAYHEQLRNRLLQTAQIDIGEFTFIDE